MDEKLTHKIQDYLDTPPSERDVVAGATLLLSLNRNKILFQNVIRKPEKFADKVEYELRKHLKIRLDGKTVSDIALMNITVIPSAQRIIDGGVPVLDVDDEFPEANVEIAKKVGAARKYLSDNKKKLAELKDTDAGKFTALLQKVQQRYDFLIATGNVVDETQAAELAAVGVNISTDEKG